MTKKIFVFETKKSVCYIAVNADGSFGSMLSFSNTPAGTWEAMTCLREQGYGDATFEKLRVAFQ